jgi:hypothetical protein
MRHGAPVRGILEHGVFRIPLPSFGEGVEGFAVEFLFEQADAFEKQGAGRQVVIGMELVDGGECQFGIVGIGDRREGRWP